MIIVTTPDVTDDQLDHIRERVESAGLRTHLVRGDQRTIIGCLGDDAMLREVALLTLPGVASVHPVLTPYKLASREFSVGSSVVRVGDGPGAQVGGKDLAIIAGPCSVEGRDMLLQTAEAVRDAGAGMLRGGAYKPRTSPYAFQGLGEEALELLAEARARTGLPIVTEVLDVRQLDVVAEHADVMQVGARNMQNYGLLSELGRVQRPVLLKRGPSARLEELLLAAEYIMAHGNPNVILCERGIRTFETKTRNTFDVAAVPVLKAETHLPVIVDPSHAGGRSSLVPALAFAAIAAGADGLIVEVHPDPEAALSDGDQSLTIGAFAAMMQKVAIFAEAAGRSLAGIPAQGAAW